MVTAGDLRKREKWFVMLMTVSTRPGAKSIRAAYIRVSTDDQNPQLQYDALIRAGISKDNIFSDIESGTITERRGYQKLCYLIRADSVYEVDVYRIDRLGRDHYELVAFFQLLEKFDVKIISLCEPFAEHWKDTAWGFRATWDAIGEARYELLRLKERQRAGIDAAKAQGKHLGRPRKVE